MTLRALIWDRFWSKVDKSGGRAACWPWRGSINPNGYGYFRVGLRVVRAHRVAFALVYGDIPEGYDVLHSCDNRPCCNPDHLSKDTRSENNRQMWARSRGRKLTKPDEPALPLRFG
jgi:HNH endonuclease